MRFLNQVFPIKPKAMIFFYFKASPAAVEAEQKKKCAKDDVGCYQNTWQDNQDQAPPPPSIERRKLQSEHC